MKSSFGQSSVFSQNSNETPQKRDEKWLSWLNEPTENIAGLEESALPVSFSRWAWALAHPVRTNYIFQLHPGKDVSKSPFVADSLKICNLNAYVSEYVTSNKRQSSQSKCQRKM